LAEENRDTNGGSRPDEGFRPDGGQNRHHGRRHWSRGRDSRDQNGSRDTAQDQETEGAASPAGPKAEPLICPICGKPLYDLSTALSSGAEDGAPAHFDCVMEKVAASETLGPGEKIVYLGSGSFGVVEFKDRSETSFTVKRRIPWEKEGEKKDWRKNLSSRISNL